MSVAQAGRYKKAIAAITATTFAGGEILGLANPEGEDLIITRFIFDVTTEATGGADADAGIAADATTSADDLLDGVDVGSAAALFDNIKDQAGNGEEAVAWDSDEYLTITPSASAAGLVGNVYIEYIRK